jgi:flagellar biosynthesis chaperone FliJ
VRTRLQLAVALKQKADDAARASAAMESRRTFLASEQDRIRRNLEAAGSATQQGQEYLKRMVALDTEIDAQNRQIEEFAKAAEAARKAFEDYLNTLEL